MLLDRLGAVLEGVGRVVGATAAAGVGAVRSLTGAGGAPSDEVDEGFEAPDGPGAW